MILTKSINQEQQKLYKYFFILILVKQAILIRADLKMSKGKAISQACHSSVESVLKSDKSKVDEWHSEGMKKVVLKVKDEKELSEYKRLAKKEKIETALIKD